MICMKHNIHLEIYFTVLFFLSLLYSYPFFGAPTAPRAFELLTRFKWSQFGTDLRQCLCFRNFFLFSFFFFHSLYSVYFAIDLNGEMLIGQNESRLFSSRRVVRQWNEMKLMICVGSDPKM